jgi:hypothetical protein
MLHDSVILLADKAILGGHIPSLYSAEVDGFGSLVCMIFGLKQESQYGLTGGSALLAQGLGALFAANGAAVVLIVCHVVYPFLVRVW